MTYVVRAYDKMSDHPDQQDTPTAVFLKESVLTVLGGGVTHLFEFIG